MKAVLLDRDGVINALVYHQEAGVIDAPFTRSQFKLLPRVPEAIRLLNDLGLSIAIVSNQPGIAKGHLKADMLKAFERTMLSQIHAAGGRIDGTYYCLHHPEAKVRKLRQHCRCRKPEIGLLELAAAELHVGGPHVRPAFVAKDLWEAAQLIRSEMTGTGQVASSANCLMAQP